MDTKRVYLWTHPRSLSTAFMRCMEGLPKTKVVFEPYMAALLFGPGGEFLHLPDCTEDLEYSYQAIKHRLEQEYKDTDLVFVKDMANGINRKYDMIPYGYQHTFLIRHPLKTYVSYNKCITANADGKVFVEKGLPGGSFYGELFKLYTYLASKEEGNLLIVDADNLLEKPELMMQMYCQQIGVEFKESILTWGPAITNNWITSTIFLERALKLPWLENSLKAGGFSKNITKPTPSFDEIPSDIKEYIQEAMPYYEELYKLRAYV